MAKTRDLQRRIRSIKNTMQLTRAMKMVAAAKLRRAQDRIMDARPYAGYMRDVLRSLASRADAEANPLLAEREGNRSEVILVSSDRGMCGSFNAGLFRKLQGHLHEHADRDWTLACLGKKGRDYFLRRANVREQWTSHMRAVEFSLAEDIAEMAMQRFVDGEVEEVWLAYNQFKSAVASEPTIERILPIEKEDLPPESAGEDYIYEPDAQVLLDQLLPRHVKILLYRAMLESIAAEHAARMSAMDAATKNAGELIDSLTLTMNRLRQASITTEIIEVVSGAEALG